MKCKVCGGTGTSNTCVNGTFKPCTFCDGTGEYEPFDADVELNKLYPTEQTNEEWLATLSTEEKAEVLNDLYWEFDYKARLYYNFEPTKKSFEKWLKQPHADKE